MHRLLWTPLSRFTDIIPNIVPRLHPLFCFRLCDSLGSNHPRRHPENLTGSRAFSRISTHMASLRRFRELCTSASSNPHYLEAMHRQPHTTSLRRFRELRPSASSNIILSRSCTGSLRWRCNRRHREPHTSVSAPAAAVIPGLMRCLSITSLLIVQVVSWYPL